MHRIPDTITALGETNFRTARQRFGIKHGDRRFHIYVIGKTGTGKSTLLENLLRQDIVAGEGLALLDPHGDLVERVVRNIPESRQPDVIYWNVPDASRPLAFNPLAGVPPSRRTLAASGLLEVFKKLWIGSWGARLEHILRNALLALLEQREATLADVLSLLVDDDFRRDTAIRLRN